MLQYNYFFRLIGFPVGFMYSLMWFIEKYGNDEGNKKYNEQRRKNVEQLIKSRNVPRKTHKCPYCELIGKGGNMKRYHFENCKMKNNFKM